MVELAVKSTKYNKAVQESRDRKKVDIVTPVAGISRDEYDRSMLQSNEYFKDV